MLYLNLCGFWTKRNIAIIDFLVIFSTIFFQVLSQADTVRTGVFSWVAHIADSEEGKKIISAMESDGVNGEMESDNTDNGVGGSAFRYTFHFLLGDIYT